jgi:hypothetical protein
VYHTFMNDELERKKLFRMMWRIGEFTLVLFVGICAMLYFINIVLK